MKRKFLIIIIIFAFFLSGSAYENIIEDQLESAQNSNFIEHVPENAENILHSLGLDVLEIETFSEITFKDLIGIVCESFIQNFKRPFKTIALIVSAVIVCSVIQSFSDSSGCTETVSNTVITLIAASAFFIPLKEIITYTTKIIEECSDFMLAFIPVYSSAIAASGYFSSATGFRSLMLAAVTIISRISGEIIVPLIMIYLALCISGSVSSVNADEIAKTVKNFSVWILTALMTVFSGILGIGTLVSSTADGNISKTAKFLIGTTVPIVGSTVSDAMSTVKSCISVTKNILGIYAIVVISAIFIPPIISIILWKFSVSFSYAAGSIFGNKPLLKLLDSVSCVIGIILALVIIIAIMFIFAVSIMLMVGSGT